jgi:NDP-sugar pyrophosphorylase family protein
MQVVFLSGGLATRLRPLSKTTPKALIPVGGVPYVYHQLNRLIQSGFTRFVFCLGHLSEPIVSYLNSLSEWRDCFTYSVEEEPLGTGGALLNAYTLLEDNFIVINVDNIWMGKYKPLIEYYYRINAQALIVIRSVKNPGNTLFNPKSSKIDHYARNSPDCKYEDIGVKIFNKSIFAGYLNKNRISLEDDIYISLIKDRKLNGFLSNDRILDIGTFENLKLTKQYISSL